MTAITSTGNKLSSLMDVRFAKCSFFYLLRQNDSVFIRNPFQNNEGHVAPLVVQWLKEQGVTRLITGEIGTIAQKSLKEAQIQTALLEANRKTIQHILSKIK
jgi:predicted Fe-Mo cluster-binding NifX family protein